MCVYILDAILHRGKGLVEVNGVTGSGRLFALEIDTEGAAAEFKAAIDGFLKKEQVVNVL